MPLVGCGRILYRIPMFGVFVCLVLIGLIAWGLPKMLGVNNKIARGERTFISDILKALTGKDKQ